MFCPNCGSELLDGSAFCPDCGAKIPAGAPGVCTACGAALPDDAEFCIECGNAVNPQCSHTEIYNLGNIKENDVERCIINCRL